MQTTLLGLAIAIILALVTALVGPLFVDWNKYRGEFEDRASQLTGLQLRVAGPIEARLLPTPALTVQRIAIFRPGDAGAVRARKVGIEFSLSSLLRGEWKATDLRVEGAEFAVGLDASGHLDWPAPSIGFDPDALSIERLDIVDSRAMLAESASGTGLVLEKLEFKGELRSLAGPIRGEGSFVMGGQHYPYRISASRAGEDGAVRVRFGIDPIDRPLLAEVDTSVWIENGIPRFEGSLNLARPVGRAPAGGDSLIIEPWRISSKIRGDSTAAVLEQIEFQYGPDDRATKLKGDAKVSFGSQPELSGVLSSTQLDLDRLLVLPEATRRRPLAAIKALTDYFAATPRLPIPVKLGISVENVTLAGATLQRVSADVKTGDVNSDNDKPDAGTWDVESLDFRAPGAAQIKLSGRLSVTPQGIAFAGPARIDARDPRGFIAWLSDRADAPAGSGPFRAEGDVRLGSDMIAIDRLQAEVDRMSLEGRLAYSWAHGDRPARIEAALTAPELNIDRMLAVAQGIFGETAFEWPREGTLAIKVGLASFNGVEAKRADVDLQFDSSGLEIHRLSVGDLGGATVAVKGEIGTGTPHSGGALTLDLDARTLDGIATVVDKFAPRTADELRRKASRLAPAKLIGSLTVNPGTSAGNNGGTATFRVEGKAGTFNINMQGSANASSDAFTVGQSFQAFGRQDQSHRPSRGRRWQCAGRVPRPRASDRGRQARRAIEFHGQRTARWRHHRARSAHRRRPRSFGEWQRSHRRPARADRRARREGAGCELAHAAAARRWTAGGDVTRRAHAAARIGRRNARSLRYRRHGCRRRGQRPLEDRVHAAGDRRRRHPDRCDQSSGHYRHRDWFARAGGECRGTLAGRAVRGRSVR